MSDREVVAASVDVHQGVAHTDVGHVRVHTDVRRRTLEPQPGRSSRTQECCKTTATFNMPAALIKMVAAVCACLEPSRHQSGWARLQTLLLTGLHLILLLLWCEARLLGDVHTITKNVLQSAI